MNSFERSLEKHSSLDARTIELLESSMGASKPTDAGDACAKCGGYRYGLEPWCQRCVRDNGAEYGPVYRAWVLERREQHLAAAGVPLHFRSCTMENYQIRTPEHRHAVDAAKVWAADPSLGLYLYGPPGVGKTHVAVAALFELVARRKAAKYVAVHELLLEARESFRDRGNRPLSAILDECTGADVLLLDDLCAEKSTEFARETFLTITDRAYAHRRPVLIATSNLDLAGLGRKLDERVADRLRELCVVVHLHGLSHRRRVAVAREGRGLRISTGSPQLTD